MNYNNNINNFYEENNFITNYEINNNNNNYYNEPNLILEPTNYFLLALNEMNEFIQQQKYQNQQTIQLQIKNNNEIENQIQIQNINNILQSQDIIIKDQTIFKGYNFSDKSFEIPFEFEQSI